MKITMDTSGLTAMKAQLRGLSDGKIKVAARAALNDAAYLASRETAKTIGEVFDRPTPWIKASVRYRKARLDKLEASVDFDQWGNKTYVTAEMVLNAEIFGGVRKLKRHEIALQRAGILPPGLAIVPGPAAKIDQYGNMAATQIIQIIAWFNAFGEQGYKANMTAKTRDRLGRDKKKAGTKGFAYFALSKPHGKLIPGIYQRIAFAHGSSVRAVMFFVRLPTYQKRLDFYRIAEEAGRREFERAFPMYLDKLLKERGL